MMMFLVVLWFSTSLANETQTLENNPFPCMFSGNTYAYQSFLSKHVRSDAPTTLDQNRWQAFIQNISTCHRPVQSFLPYNQKQQVDNVCSAYGGKTYRENLCISKQEFIFTTVYVDNNCIVTKVSPEKKYIILACDKIENACRPVHFEANWNNIGPNPSNPDCRNPNYRNHAELAHSAPGFLTLALLVALAHFI